MKKTAVFVIALGITLSVSAQDQRPYCSATHPVEGFRCGIRTSDASGKCGSHKIGRDSRVYIDDDGKPISIPLSIKSCDGTFVRLSKTIPRDLIMSYQSAECYVEEERKLAETSFRQPDLTKSAQVFSVSLFQLALVKDNYELIILKDSKPVYRKKSGLPSNATADGYSAAFVWVDKNIKLPIEVVIVDIFDGKRVLHYRIDPENLTE